MKILYNDEGYLSDWIDHLFCWDGIINVNNLEHLAECGGHGGGDDIALFTYSDDNIFSQTGWKSRFNHLGQSHL